MHRLQGATYSSFTSGMKHESEKAIAREGHFHRKAPCPRQERIADEEACLRLLRVNRRGPSEVRSLISTRPTQPSMRPYPMYLLILLPHILSCALYPFPPLSSLRRHSTRVVRAGQTRRKLAY